MSFRGKFEWYNSLQQGGKKAISFTLTCKNMMMTETFDCAIVDSTGQEPPLIRRQLKLKPIESLTFNYDSCRWNWCQGDYFCILGKKDKIEQRWDLNLKVYARGECPECHGSHRCQCCNGNGVIEDRHTHSINTCSVCKGTGICQTCYVPIRSGTTLSQEVYGYQPLPDTDQKRQRKIAALQQTISELQSKIEKTEWDMRMMQLKDMDRYARTAYMSNVEMLHAFRQQLIQAQYKLQQLESMR